MVLCAMSARKCHLKTGKIPFPIYKLLQMGYNVRKVNVEVCHERAEIENFF